MNTYHIICFDGSVQQIQHQAPLETGDTLAGTISNFGASGYLYGYRTSTAG